MDQINIADKCDKANLMMPNRMSKAGRVKPSFDIAVPSLDMNRVNTHFYLIGTKYGLSYLAKKLRALNDASLSTLFANTDIPCYELGRRCNEAKIENVSIHQNHIELYISTKESIPYKAIDVLCEKIGGLDAYFRVLSPYNSKPLKRTHETYELFLEEYYVYNAEKKNADGAYDERYCLSAVDVREFIIKSLSEIFRLNNKWLLSIDEMGKMPFYKLRNLGEVFDIYTIQYKCNSYVRVTDFPADESGMPIMKPRFTLPLLTSANTVERENAIIDAKDVIYSNNYDKLIWASKDLKGHYTVHDGTKSICTRAFAKCASLTSITIPSSVQIIGDLAFNECVSLKNVIFNEGLKRIGIAAFQFTGLEAITFPNGLERINHGAFNQCVNLKHIEIPPSVVFIGDGCFDESNLDEESKRTLAFRFDKKPINH